MNTILSFETFLTETFESSFNFKKTRDRPIDKIYKFTTDQGKQGEVVFTSISVIHGRKSIANSDPKQSWEVDFTIDDEWQATGGGEQMKIFGTVIAVIKSFVTEYKPQEIQFSAAKNESEPPSNKVSARGKLYDRMVNRLLQQFEIKKYQKIDTGSVFKFYLVF